MSAGWVAANAIDGYLGMVDYMVVIYLLAAKKVNEKNYIQFAFLFGLFYDLVLGTYIGLSVIVFLLFNIITLRSGVMMNLKKKHFLYGYYALLSVLFVLYNLLLAGYEGVALFIELLTRTAVDLVAIAIVLIIMEITRAISHSKR